MKPKEHEDEMKETSTEEAAESHDKQQTEEVEGTEGVKLPEEFQKECYDMTEKCDTEAKCNYLHQCLYDKEREIRQAEDKKKGKKGSKGPVEFTTADMPSD